MTANTVTVQRIASLLALLESATDSLAKLSWEIKCGDIDPAEAAAIVNETIQNLVNEAR